MAGIRGTHTRALTLVRWSHPSLCPFCEGRRVVELVVLDDAPVGAPMGCPHCAGLQPIEIRVYPRFRTDRPRGDAA